MIALLFALTALAASVQSSTPSLAHAMTLAPVDGGVNYYARFSHALPTSKSYFPIGPWLESVSSPADVTRDKDVGLNLYVTVTANSDLPVVSSTGMRVIAQQSEWRTRETQSGAEAMTGWELADEIDMQGSPASGYSTLNQILATLPADGRLRYNNYAKGVAFWLSDQHAARYVNEFQDVLSADNYWFTDENICSGTEGGKLVAGGADLSPADCHRAANYGATVRRVRSLVSPARSKPVWAFVELGHPFSEAHWPTITPEQVRAAVWHSLIAGARGIIYFNHSFGGPDQTQHILRDGLEAGSAYAPIRSVVKATNDRIKELAPVLNSPTVTSGWSNGPGTVAMVKWVNGKQSAKKRCKSKAKNKKRKCRKVEGAKAAKKRCKSKKKRKCKKVNGHLYLFAGSAGSSVEGKFKLPCVGDAKAAVVGENRTIPVRKGSFSDRFAGGNAIHIYRISGGSTCGLQREGKSP